MPDDVWFLYLVRTSGGHLYTGISTDVKRRFAEHQAGKGAKYLRGKGPLELVLQQKIGTRSAALKAELHVKRQRRHAKEQAIIQGGFALPAESSSIG